MAVTFTPNIGLAKPDEAELAENWVNGPKLQEDNNLIIVDKTDINMTTYSPSFIAHTTNPSVGTGFKDGDYIDIQGFIIGHFVIEFFDAGISAGSGEYGISLPFPIDSTYHSVGTALNQDPGTFSIIGEAYLHDNSSVGGSGSCAIDVVTISGVSYARMITETFTGKTSRFVRDAMPFTVANNDKFTGNFMYKKA